MKVLLAAGANVNHRTKSGQTALIISAAAGDFMSLQALLAAKASVDVRDSIGRTAIFGTVHDSQSGHIQCLKALIAAGADLNAVDREGQTPLSEAQGQSKVIAILKAAGAKN